VSLIVDGYNLIHAAGIIGRGVGPGGLERSRLTLLNFIVESIEPAEIPNTTVVFDAMNAPPGLPHTLAHRGLLVRFAPSPSDADALIEDLIRRDSAPRRLTVVSSDHRLQRAAKRRKARAVDSDVWFDEIKARRKRRTQAKTDDERSVKPDRPPSSSEIEFWLTRFAEDETPVDHSPADDIFPPGYAEDASEEKLE
jgi:predicted RNA-binding protein with PIN domain